MHDRVTIHHEKLLFLYYRERLSEQLVKFGRDRTLNRIPLSRLFRLFGEPGSIISDLAIDDKV